MVQQTTILGNRRPTPETRVDHWRRSDEPEPVATPANSAVPAHLRPSSPHSPEWSRIPGSVEETGLGLAFISDLVLKIIYMNDQITGGEISNWVCLRYGNIIDRALMLLRREHLVDTTSRGVVSELGYGYTITEKGVARVLQVMERNAYVGPAPITVQHYADMVKHQAISEVRVSPEMVRSAMAELVIEDRVLRDIGRAVNTGRSLFLFGHPGNGKTMIAEHIVPLLGGDVFIPHAVSIDGQVIKVYDPPNHEPLESPGDRPPYDPRLVLCMRPAIIVGGELTLEGLDLSYDSAAKVYQAPLQMKANGGMFLIDDFGRQLVTPKALLNRWIVPLEKRVDYLTLRTGKKIEIPFDQLLVFSTNLAPKDLVDEAFLRRIQNKMNIVNPTREAFCEIFRRQCDALGVGYDPNGLEHLLREHYDKPQREFRSCHPRDLLRTMAGIARYDGSPAILTPELIDHACETYFVQF